MIARLSWGAGLALAVLVSLCDVTDTTEHCPASKPPPPFTGIEVGGRGLGSLLESARSTREGIFGDELPYHFIRDEFRKVYNTTTSLDTDAFLSEWMDYSQSALFLGGFVVFVGVILPGVIISLWSFWECCYEEDEDEDEDNRNLTKTAQVIAWTLGTCLTVILVCLTVFVCILLAGNSRVSRGVDRGKDAVGTVLPELVSIRDGALTEVNRSVLVRYDSLMKMLDSEILDPISPAIVSDIDKQFHAKVTDLTSEVHSQLSLHPSLLRNGTALREDQSLLEDRPLQAIADSLNQSLSLLEAECQRLPSNASMTQSGADLEQLCGELVNGTGSYFPRVSVNFTSLGGRKEEGGMLWLDEVLTVLQGEDFETSATANDSQFLAFLDKLDRNVSLHVASTSEDYLGSVRSRLALFVNLVVSDYLPVLHFGWPRSQEKLDVYLGSRHLGNWEEFRFVFTVTFALVLLVLVLCVGGAMGRGLFNVTSIYRYGEDTSYIEGAHQSGTMLKKLTFGFAGVCFVSAVFYGFFLSASGVLGRTCGPYNNFSDSILTHVIDIPSTWRDEYPLGRALIGDPQYLLTVEDFVDRCRGNQSLYVTFDLEKRGGSYILEDSIYVTNTEMYEYTLNMKLIAVAIGEEKLSLLSSLAQAHLQLLREAADYPVQWDNYTTLATESLFQEEFVGTRGIQDLLEAMREAIGGQDAYRNLSSAVETVNTSLIPLENYTTWFEELLPSLHQSAGVLRDSLVGVASSSLLELVSELESNITVESGRSSNSRLVSTSIRVNNALTTYIDDTRTTIRCEIGRCLSLAEKYDLFTSALCADIVPGMDIYWTSLVIILSISIVLIPLGLLLASRFIDLDFEKASDKSATFHQAEAIILQLRAFVWLMFSISINLWLVGTISRDRRFHDECAGTSECCASCVWGFGVVFAILSILVGGATQIYQCVVIYRIKKCDTLEVRRLKVRRYWMDRRKAFRFYGQLGQLIVQDFPFLILAGVYADHSGVLTVPSVFSLAISLIGILTYLMYLFREWRNVRVYLTWLRAELTKKAKFQPQDSPNESGRRGQMELTNGVPHSGGRSPYGSSESEQSEDDSQGTYQDDTGFTYYHTHSRNRGPASVVSPSQRLSDIAEGSEDQLEGLPDYPGGREGGSMGRRGRERGHREQPSSDESQQRSMVMLDRVVTDSEGEDIVRRREEGAMARALGGVDIVDPYYRHTDYETSTTRSDSYFGSQGSIPTTSGLPTYYTGSQGPGYESSDYREDLDYESDHSQPHRYPRRLRLNGSITGEMCVEV